MEQVLKERRMACVLLQGRGWTGHWPEALLLQVAAGSAENPSDCRGEELGRGGCSMGKIQDVTRTHWRMR